MVGANQAGNSAVSAAEDDAGKKRPQWTIRSQLTFASMIALIIVLSVGVMGVFQLRQVNTITQQLGDVSVPKIESLATIKRALITHNSLAKKQMLTQDYRQLSTFGTSMKSFEREMAGGLAIYSRTVLSQTEKARLAEFREHWSNYLQMQEVVYRQQLKGETATARAAFDTTVTEYFDKGLHTVGLLETLSNAQTSQFRQAVEETYNRAQLLTVVLSAVAVCAALLAAWWTSRHISTPLLRITDTMRRLTEGDYTAEVPNAGRRNDEIGTLIDAAKTYRASVLNSRELAVEAEKERQRLLAAISNMPLGFCMFDGDQRLIICNDHYAKLYDIPDALREPGTPFIELVRDRAAKGMFYGDDPQAFIEESVRIASERQKGTATLTYNDGRTINVLAQPLSEGWLSMHEDVTERRAAEERIRHMARHDSLTDLPNRNLFSERIEQVLQRSRRGKSRAAILCLDLDRFKAVNDTLGHPIGDKLLKMVAERLKACTRSQDTIARLGGDEFAIIQTHGDQPDAAAMLSRRVIEAINKPFKIDGHNLSIGTSVGIAILPDDGDTADKLLKNADMALYRAKNDGRGTYRMFESQMDIAIQERRRMELDLRKAFANNVLTLEYQPQVDVIHGKVTGVEALLRWNDPERGYVSPAEFIPLAEEIGLMVPIGEWVLKQACKDAKNWPSDITVAVNLSPVQFRTGQIEQTVEKALSEADLSPQRLELEITEGVLLADDQVNLKTLHEIRETGVRISMDDFGTGYSSLGYLRNFPFDKIKIDASFVRNLTKEKSSLAIVRAVTGLAGSLGISTIAEGVETQKQLDIVREEGCGEVQGFLFSKSVPPEQVLDVISKIEARKFKAA